MARSSPRRGGSASEAVREGCAKSRRCDGVSGRLRRLLHRAFNQLADSRNAVRQTCGNPVRATHARWPLRAVRQTRATRRMRLVASNAKHVRPVARGSAEDSGETRAANGVVVTLRRKWPCRSKPRYLAGVLPSFAKATEGIFLSAPERKMVDPTGLEPVTSSMSRKRSNQLS